MWFSVLKFVEHSKYVMLNLEVGIVLTLSERSKVLASISEGIFFQGNEEAMSLSGRPTIHIM